MWRVVGGIQTKNPSDARVWILSGTMHWQRAIVGGDFCVSTQNDQRVSKYFGCH